MELLVDFDPWWRFAAALLIGALIGLEREFVQQRSGDPEFAGIRTFSLIALLGAVGAYFARQHGVLVFVAAYIGLVALIWASYFGELRREHEEGVTTEVAGLIVPLLGAMVIWDRVELAAALGVTTALLLALKPRLHNLARSMSAGDLRATLEFALISAVILPILPNQSYGPFQVINPFQIWLFVVLVSGIGFLGYVLIKVLGAEQGIGLTGLLGGLVSSTATTISFAGRGKGNPHLSSVLVMGIVISSSVMLPRVLTEVAVVHPPLLPLIAPPISAMLITGAVIVVVLWRRRSALPEEGRARAEVANPLRISAAITFGLVFLAVLLGVRAANEFFGEAGVFVASAITGIVDVDAITLSAAELASTGQIEPPVAAISVLLASLVNTAAKAAMAMALGARAMRRPLCLAFGILIAVGILASAISMQFTGP